MTSYWTTITLFVLWSRSPYFWLPAFWCFLLFRGMAQICVQVRSRIAVRKDLASTENKPTRTMDVIVRRAAEWFLAANVVSSFLNSYCSRIFSPWATVSLYHLQQLVLLLDTHRLAGTLQKFNNNSVHLSSTVSIINHLNQKSWKSFFSPQWWCHYLYSQFLMPTLRAVTARWTVVQNVQKPVASQIAWIPAARPVRHQVNARRPVNRNRNPGVKTPGFLLISS